MFRHHLPCGVVGRVVAVACSLSSLARRLVGLVVAVACCLNIFVVPARALGAVLNVQATANPPTAGVADVEYTFQFSLQSGLAASRWIRIVFPTGFIIPVTIETSAVSVVGGYSQVQTGSVSVYGQEIVIWIANDTIGVGAGVTVVLRSSAHIQNPAIATAYPVSVSTQDDPAGTGSLTIGTGGGGGGGTGVGGVTAVSAWANPSNAGKVAEYTVSFAVASDKPLIGGIDWVDVEFPTGSTVPSSIPAGTIMIKNAPATAVTVEGMRVRVWVPEGLGFVAPTCNVIFRQDAGILHPAVPGNYALRVATRQQPNYSSSNTYSVVGTAVLNPSVVVTPARQGMAARYELTFTSSLTGALTAGTGRITVEFPAGTTIPTSLPASGIRINDVPSLAVLAVAANKLAITVPVAIAGGSTVRVVFGVDLGIRNPTVVGTYQLGISTSGDATPVPVTYAVSSSQIGAVTAQVTNGAAGQVSAYTVAFTTGPGGALAAGIDRINIEFPAGTTIPTSLAASSVTVNGTPSTLVNAAGMIVSITVPVGVAASSQVTVVFAEAAAVRNPVTPGTYTQGISTTCDTPVIVSSGYVISAAVLTVTVIGSGSIIRSPDQTVYSAGAAVTVTAVPTTGYQFSGWSGDATGADNPLTVTMTANKSITATFVQMFALNALASPASGGTVTKNPNQSTYVLGSGVQLTAIPANGYVFSGWFGDISGTSNPIVVSMTGNKNVSASFTALPNEYYLLSTPAPLVGGTVTKTPDQPYYTSGSAVQLMATALTGYVFSGWSGDASGTMNPLTVTMDRSRFITATFTLQAPQTYAVTVSVTGQGTVARTPDSSAYEAGTSVQLLAAPATGWRFIGWIGDVTGVANPATLVVSRAHTVIAQFEPTAPTLTSSLHTVVVGEGAIVRSPDRSLFDPIETVELRAVPATGWVFTRWEGDLSGTTPTMRLPMTTSKAVVAVFERIPEEKQWNAVISSGANGTVTPSGTQTVKDGNTVHIELQPNAGYEIDKFLVDGVSVALPSTVAQSYDLGPVTANRQVHCTFKVISTVPDTHVVRLTIGSTWLTIDGKQTALDAAPVIQISRTLLPIRAIVEAFGGTIEWYADLRVVTMYLNGRQVSLQIGNPQGFVDGVQKPLDATDPKVVPIIISGRTFLPLRFVAENLGLQVTWDAATRTVTVTS